MGVRSGYAAVDAPVEYDVVSVHIPSATHDHETAVGEVPASSGRRFRLKPFVLGDAFVAEQPERAFRHWARGRGEITAPEDRRARRQRRPAVVESARVEAQELSAVVVANERNRSVATHHI